MSRDKENIDKHFVRLQQALKIADLKYDIKVLKLITDMDRLLGEEQEHTTIAKINEVIERNK